MKLHKSIIAFGFLLMVSSGFIYQSALQLDFYLNQSEITDKFCENKDKPALKCNGQCHLAKTLKESQKVDTENPVLPTLKTENILPLYFNSIHFGLSLSGSFEHELGTSNFIVPHLSKGHYLSLLDPPELFI